MQKTRFYGVIVAFSVLLLAGSVSAHACGSTQIKYFVEPPLPPNSFLGIRHIADVSPKICRYWKTQATLQGGKEYGTKRNVPSKKIEFQIELYGNAYSACEKEISKRVRDNLIRTTDGFHTCVDVTSAQKKAFNQRVAEEQKSYDNSNRIFRPPMPPSNPNVGQGEKPIEGPCKELRTC